MRLSAFSSAFLLATTLLSQAPPPARADEVARSGHPDLAPPADVAAPPRDARKTRSGLAMKVVQPGTGKAHPHPNDCVRIHFVAWTRTGQLAGASSADDNGEQQCLLGMTPGLAEATAAMLVGERRRVWIPKTLAFPSDPHDGPSPHATDLTYDLVLLKILAAPPTPRSLKTPSARARKLPSGVAIEIVKKGTGRTHPNEVHQMTLRLSGWTSDGKLFESYRMRDHITVFRIAELVPGLGQAVQEMVEGDVALIWVPVALAYGDKPRRNQPAGNLIYEVELAELK